MRGLRTRLTDRSQKMPDVAGGRLDGPLAGHDPAP